MSDVQTDDWPGDLDLRAPRRWLFASYALPPAAFAALIWWRDNAEGPAGVLTWIAVGVFATLAVFGFAISLSPTRLTATRQGLSWTRVGRTRRAAWRDIEAIGVAHPRGLEGYDRPLVRVLSRVSKAEYRARTAPMIGITLTAEASPIRNLATRAYRMGFNGYEDSVVGAFSQPVEEIVAELQSRLASARRRDAQA